MHKHRETGKIVKVLNMDTDTTYTDEDGHSKTLDTAHFNSLYEETSESGAFGSDDVSVAELLVEIDRMKQDHAATVDALKNDFSKQRQEYITHINVLTEAHDGFQKLSVDLADKLALANADLDARCAIIVDKDKTIQAQTDQIAELTKAKETGKK